MPPASPWISKSFIKNRMILHKCAMRSEIFGLGGIGLGGISTIVERNIYRVALPEIEHFPDRTRLRCKRMTVLRLVLLLALRLVLIHYSSFCFLQLSSKEWGKCVCLTSKNVASRPTALPDSAISGTRARSNADRDVSGRGIGSASFGAASPTYCARDSLQSSSCDFCNGQKILFGRSVKNEEADVIAKLAFEAEFRDIRIGELLGALIAATMEKDLLPLILDTEKDTDQPPLNGPGGMLVRLAVAPTVTCPDSSDHG